MNDDWLHTGRLKEKVDQGNWETKMGSGRNRRITPFLLHGN